MTEPEPTLRSLHDRLDALAVGDGRYIVMCARSGDRPVPVDELRFANRETAVEAARLAHRYRALLRRYDRRLSRHTLVVCEDTGSGDREGIAGAEWHRRFWTIADRELDRFRAVCGGGGGVSDS